MPMNSTSQNPGRKFPLGSGPNSINNRTLYATLGVATAAAFLFILVLYAWHGLNPLNRIGYGVFMSLLPAVGAFVVLKFTNFFASWRGAAIVYLVLFVL